MPIYTETVHQHDKVILYFYRMIYPKTSEKWMAFFPTEQGRNGQVRKFRTYAPGVHTGSILEIGVWTPLGETITKTEQLP